MNRLIFPRELWERLDAHLRRAAPNEDGAFLLLGLGQGLRGTRFVVQELLLPEPYAWEAQGCHNLRPSGQWLSAVIGAAIETDSAIGFVHSHPGSTHPPTLSSIDEETSVEWSRVLTQLIGRPFLSLVWTSAGVNGCMFEPEQPSRQQDIDRVQVLGQGSMQWLHPPVPEPNDTEIDDRQVRAIGQLGNSRLRQLHVALVGAGGTGSPTGEQLVRMGVEHLVVIDPDRIDTESNLRRVVGSRHEDLTNHALKAEVLGNHLRRLELCREVTVLPVDVRREMTARALLDVDLVISTTDTHSSRSFVNQVALQYSVPLLDVGLRVGTSRIGEISGMPVDVRIVLPDTGCLWCRGLLDAGRVRAENLPEDERTAQIKEGYIQSLADPQPSLTSLNYFAASAALLTMLRLISSKEVVQKSFIVDAWEHYFVDVNEGIDQGCICRSWRGMADRMRIAYLPPSTEAA